MSTGEMAIWVGLMLLGFAGSALFSGMETGSYCLNRVRLHVRASRGDRSAQRLRAFIGAPSTLLSTLLIGNNIVNYLGTASLAVLLNTTGLTEAEKIALNVAIVTPLLFVFGETLPKDLFSAHADRLMPPLERVLTGAHWLFTATGLVPVVRAFAWGVMRLIGQRGNAPVFHPRRQIGDLVREGVGHGLLTEAQSRIVERVLALRGMTVGGRMSPWPRVTKVHVDDDLGALRDLATSSTRSRFPVVNGVGEVVGAIYVLDVLAADHDGGATARDLMQPVIRLPEEAPLRRGLRDLQAASLNLAIVTGQDGQPAGVITPKDLVEPVTGELPGW